MIPPEGMRGEDGTVDPIDVAFNQLCEKGIQYTINHAHDNQVSSDAMNRLNMRALFGLQLKEDVDYAIVPLDKPEVVPVTVDRLRSMKLSRTTISMIINARPN